MKYMVITPARNESKYIKQTIVSVTNQTILPDRWIIVDDGSTDDTVQIVNQYVKKFSWIQLHKLDTKDEKRQGGSKVVNAFNEGLKIIRGLEWDFIVKLDADLILPENYFEEILNVFNNDAKIGLAGGIIMNKKGDTYVQEGGINYHIRGAFKTYRRACFEEIQGFKPVWNWDGLDEMEALYKGWKTKCVDLKVKHLRPTTSAYDKSEHGRKSGYNAYQMRTSTSLILMRFIRNIFTKPYLLYGLYYLDGYRRAFISKPEYIIEKDLGKFINKFHIKRILKFLK